MSDNEVLYQRKISIAYSVVDIVGKKELISLTTPFWGVADVEFQMGCVFVNTTRFDEVEEVHVTVYDGKPKLDSLPNDMVCISGVIEVGNEGLVLGVGGSKEARFPWPEGLTAIFVILKTTEMREKRVKTITFYLKSLTRFRRENWIKRLFRERKG